MGSPLSKLLSNVSEEVSAESPLGRLCLGLCVKGRLAPCSARDVKEVSKNVNVDDGLGLECVKAGSLNTESLIKEYMCMVASLWIALSRFEGAALSEFNADPQSLTVTFDLQSPDGYSNSVELMGVPSGEGLKWWVVCDGVLIKIIKPPLNVRDSVLAASEVIESITRGSTD